MKYQELENNKNFQKGDSVILPVGFGYKILEVLEDDLGLYCEDSCGGKSNKRHIYSSEHNKWNTSLIKELGFRKIKTVDEKGN